MTVTKEIRISGEYRTEHERGELSDVPWLLSTRLMLAVLAFMGFVLLYSQRVGMSVAIICMVNQTYVQTQNMEIINDNLLKSPNISSEVDNEGDVCKIQDNNRTMQEGPFNWEKGMQGHLLGAAFYGYVISQIPAGLLSQRFGAKWVYAGFYLLSSVSTILTPVAARLHYGFAIAVRVLSGIGTGAAFPTMHSFWGHWAPPFERSKLAGITYAGFTVANVVTFPVSGVLCEHGFDGGWASIFYIFGGLSLVWLVFWTVLVSDNPSGCQCISNKEKMYITNSLKEQVSESKEFKTPWLSFVTSLPVWAITVANITSDWGVYTLLTSTPTYMNEVLKFDIQMNGLFSALPFLGSWMGIYIFSVLADKLVSTGRFSTGTTRKIFNTIGMIGPAIFLIGLGFVDCTRSYVGVILLTLANTCQGGVYSGFLINHMDIAPQYAGTLIGITNCIAAITGFIAPYLAAVLTINQSREEWQVVLFITAALQISGAIFYIVLASGEPQSWALQKKMDIATYVTMESKTNDSIEEKEKMIFKP